MVLMFSGLYFFFFLFDDWKLEIIAIAGECRLDIFWVLVAGKGGHGYEVLFSFLFFRSHSVCKKKKKSII